MEEIQGLPIGTQSFEALRDYRNFYVDKTHYIERLLQLGRFIFLSRPRRFGKSLFLSTLKAYFEGKKELFKGLYIENAEEEMARRQGRAAWEEYPVLYFDFSDKNYTRSTALAEILQRNFDFLEDEYQLHLQYTQPEDRLSEMIRTLYKRTGRKVVILIDEYDKPLLETLEDDTLYEANRAALKAFYTVLKSNDAYIRFAFLTGVTKFSKVTIFSGLNNLNDISLIPEFSAICGFTEEELKRDFTPALTRLSESLNISYSETLAALKKHYDGYCFAHNGEHVYNPFSLLKSLSDKCLGDYWFATATPTFLVKYLLRVRYFVPDLENGVEIGISALQDFRVNDEDPMPLLFQSGYLTIKKLLPDGRRYLLAYPNEEVRNGLLENLLAGYAALPFSRTGSSVGKIYDALNVGDLARVMKQIEGLLAGIPYGNLPRNKKGQNLREQYYQTVFYLIFRLLVEYTYAEVVCATGRVDMVVEMPQHIYIFEFKVTSAGTPDDAIAQIKAQGYATPFAADPRTVHLVGVSFNERKRNIEAWREEVLVR